MYVAAINVLRSTSGKEMKVVTTRAQLAGIIGQADSSKTGFVPTMGALHKGHISLVERAREENETVVVSIFVNPNQFNDPNDLRSYPRTPESDLRMLEEAGADIVFMPAVEEIYPEPDTRVFDFGTTDKVMEGATRPGHFNGVAQVVSRLFNMVKPARAYFGEKDFQQVAVIRAMVRQLGSQVAIIACPTVREADGLAMSSRNTLLTPEHRKAAPAIYRAMQEGRRIARQAIAAGNSPDPREIERLVTGMVNSERLLEVIYFRLVDAVTLADAQNWDSPDGVQGCIAVQAGRVRLIDNLKW